uniref:Uncharacterized protein n=1 Tax=Monopterus albus TaxID=43700 RepID=A0A3Q3J021_MONAL
MASWFSWNEPYYRSRCRDPANVVTDTLMLEFSWQLKETGVDYSWLASTPRSSYNISIGERLSLEGLCFKVPPSCCSFVILK